MEVYRKSALFVLLSLLSLAVPRTGFPQEATYGDYFYGIGTKLVRGVGHILSSPADIPCTTAFEMRERVNDAAGFFVGLGKGTLLMLRRILVGVTEVGTFMIPA